MATFTVDLPAHNAYVEPTEDLVSVIGSDGLETLAANDTDSYIRFDKDPATGGGNGWAFRVGRGGSMLGFGLWDQPPGSTVTDVRFVMRARLPFGGGGDIPDDGDGSYGDGSYPPGWTNLPVYRWPMVDIIYQAAPYDGGYNFSQIRTDGQWDDLECNVPLAHFLPSLTTGTADYVISGIGEPDTGINGLCPRVFVDHDYPLPNVPFVHNVAVDLAYLAIRITYTTVGVAPPCHIFPRDDDQGVGTAATWPPPSSGQPGGYY